MDLMYRFLSPKKRQELQQVFESELGSLVEQIKTKITSVGIRKRTGALLNSVGYKITGTLTGVVYVNAKYASYLEDGYTGFDMKPGLLKSKNAKVGREGQTYARIPLGNGKFRTVSSRAIRKSKTAEYVLGTGKWLHPGYEGKMFFQGTITKVLPHIVKRVENSFSELLEGEE